MEFDRRCSTERRHDPLTIMDFSGRVLGVKSGWFCSCVDDGVPKCWLMIVHNTGNATEAQRVHHGEIDEGMPVKKQPRKDQ